MADYRSLLQGSAASSNGMPIAAWPSQRPPSAVAPMVDHQPLELGSLGSRRWPAWVGAFQWLIGFAAVGTLLVLGAANIALRATWHQVEDGVLWADSRDAGVVAKDIAPRTPAAGVIRRGDILQAIDGQPIDRKADIDRLLALSREGDAHS